MLLSLVILSGCTALQSRSLREILLMATEDGDRELSEPMRPPRGGTRVLIFALDGVGGDDFLRAVRSGRMPHVAKLLGDETGEEDQFARSYAPGGVLSVLPSTTVAAWTSTFTGRPPAETGIPGNEWFDRADMSFHAPGPVTTDRRYQVVGNYNEDLLGRQIHVPTLFERANVRSYVSLLPVYRGADLLGIPDVKPFGTLFYAGLRKLFGADSAQARLYEKLDEVSIKSLDNSLDKYGLADLQTIYFPGIDLFTHIAPDPLESQQRYLSLVIDPAVGDVLDRYREEGVLNSTFVLFISDHGQTETRPDSRNSLFREGPHEPPELLERAGFRVRPRNLHLKPGEENFQAVIAMQGGMAYVYLADRTTCVAPGSRCDWDRPPREEDVMAAVHAFDLANRRGLLVPAMEGTLDMILARTGSSAADPSVPFLAFDGTRLVALGEYLTKHPRPDLLNLEQRLRDLAVGPYGYRAGDVLLLSRMRLEDPVEDRTYFGEAYHSWHGSPNRHNSEVVFVLAHPTLGGTALREIAATPHGDPSSQMDLTSLVLSLLDRK